jgi:hypothetical protein
MVCCVPVTGVFGLSGQVGSGMPGWLSGWQTTGKVGPNMAKNEESRPQRFVSASEQQASIVSAGAFGITIGTLAQELVPHARVAAPPALVPAPPLTPAAPAVPEPPVPPLGVGCESVVLPHAGTATAATKPPATKTLIARKNMGQCNHAALLNASPSGGGQRAAGLPANFKSNEFDRE